MNKVTKKHLKLNNHLYHNGGSKTICVSTCLNFLGIEINSYNYTSSNKNVNSYESVVRRNGYSLRSRYSELCPKKLETTMTQLKKSIKKKNYTDRDLFLVSGYQSKCAHLMVLNGNGETIIDTAPGKKLYIRSVKLINHK